MKRILAILFGIGLIGSFPAAAQIITDYGDYSHMLILTKSSDDAAELEGTPYMNDNFQPGTFTIEGKAPAKAFLRYNVVNEEMEIKTELNGTDTYLLPGNSKATYQIGSNNYVFRNLQIDGSLVKGYFIEHYKGESLSLYEKLTATTTEPEKAQTAYHKDKPGRIVMEDRFFLEFDNGNVQEVKLRTRDFKKALPNSKAVNSYLSDNKVKSIEDYINMLEWYDKQT